MEAKYLSLFFVLCMSSVSAYYLPPNWSGINPALTNFNPAGYGWNGLGVNPYGGGHYPGGLTAPPSNIHGGDYGYGPNPFGQGVANYNPYVSGYHPGHSYGPQIDEYGRFTSSKPFTEKEKEEARQFAIKRGFGIWV